MQLFSVIALLVSASLAAPIDVNSADVDVGILWNRVHRAIIKSFKISPPIASRNMAIVHTSMYRMYSNILVKSANKPTEASIAAYQILAGLYNASNPNFAIAISANNAPTFTNAPKGSPGAAEAISSLAKHNGIATQTNAFSHAYTPRTVMDASAWTPLPGQSALLPNYGRYTPFVMGNASFYEKFPYKLSSNEFIDAYKEVKDFGHANSKVRTSNQTTIAWFWHDGPPTPPGHWNQIAEILALKKSFKSENSVAMYYVLNLALADAGIACWNTKYNSYRFRPVTAIATNTAIDRNKLPQDSTWQSLIPTPPFPEYVSGHSTFSAAAGSVLKNFFGDVPFSQNDHETVAGSLTRSFNSITTAVNEAGKSRIYGGIHFQTANVQGLATGQLLGKAIWNRCKVEDLVRKTLYRGQ